MRLHKSVFLLAISPLISSPKTLAVTVPLITREDQNEVGNGNETNKPQNYNSSAHGLGSDPVNIGHGQPHNKHFFEATPENINASRFGRAYALWIIKVDKTSTAWQNRLSEPDFFAKTVLEWPDDVNCGITYNGCDGKPQCSDISERIENRWRARQICFIFDSFHHVSLINAQIHEQSKAAQAAGEARTRSLAETFFWQFDAAIQKKCEMYANLVKAAIAAVEFAFIAAAPLMAPAEIGVMAATEEFIATEVAGLGEGATLEEIGEGVGEEVEEISTGSTVGSGENPGPGPDEGGVTGPNGGNNAGGGNDDGGENAGGENHDGGNTETDGKDRPGSEDGGPGSTGDGTNEHPRPPDNKQETRAKSPWDTKPSWLKRGGEGAGKKIGWHRIAQGKTNVLTSALVALPVTLASPAITDSLCASFPNANPGDVEKWQKLLSERILGAGQTYRLNIDSLLKEMNQGNGFGENGTFVEPFISILAETMYLGDYVRLTEYERDYFIEETAKLEMAMTGHFINAAISVSLKSSMCYLHCTENLEASDVDPTVFTIDVNPVTRCQAQCWQNWDQTKQLKMFGLQKLMNDNNSWGTNATEFLTHSYNHWEWSRYQPEIMFPTIHQLREGTSSNSTSGAAVPVCFSSQPIHSYNKKNNLDKALPCICGDDFGNETLSFFREASFASWVAVEGGKGLAEACQTSFEIDETWPVPAYLAYCYLGWHFPVEADKHNASNPDHKKHRFAWGADFMCEQVKEEVQEVIERGGSSMDVNCHLCWLSETGKTIKKNQRSYVRHDSNDHRNRYNFEKACEKQMGKMDVCKLIT